uniref:Uncharacterized protein n=1 Tax=Romanomermis culicivorax TaxID=13658 RepID=A0A915I665_ROMCU
MVYIFVEKSAISNLSITITLPYGFRTADRIHFTKSIEIG